MLWLSINYVQLPYCPHGHECRDKFRIFNEFSELFFLQSGMILQQKLGGRACVYFGLSLIHTGSERNVYAQIYTYIHLNLFKKWYYSTMSFNLTRSTNC